MLKASVLNSSRGIPTWQELVDGKEWLQCSPAMSAKLDFDVRNPSCAIDSARYRYVPLDSGSIGAIQLPHTMKIEPYLASANADDIAMLNMRVHDSLPEWDVTAMQQVANAALASKYAAYRHRVAARCNGNPNERMMFHFAHPAVMTKIWQEGEGHDPRLSNWAEVGKGAYFSKHPMYGYAYKYGLWPSPPSFEVKAEPPIGETMQVFASLVCLGNVADMGPGCETCPSPAWDAWKKEPPILPKPTRPPAMPLSTDVAEKQHILDLSQVKDAPRYDSVISTEGDLGTHPASTNKDASGRRICDIMHPRLRARAKEWAEQCVLFDAAASYPMFVATLTKTRDSPMGLQQLMDAGCDANRIKALGFTASDVKALGKTVHEMRAARWHVLDLKNAPFDIGQLLEGGCIAAEMKAVGFTALQMKNAGLTAHTMRDAGWTASELKNEGYDARSLLTGGYSVPDLKEANFRASQMVDNDAGRLIFNARIARELGYSLVELTADGFDVQWLISGGWSLEELRSHRHTAGLSISDLKASGIDVRRLFEAGYNVDELKSGGFEVAGFPRSFVARDFCIDITDSMGCDVAPNNHSLCWFFSYYFNFLQLKAKEHQFYSKIFYNAIWTFFVALKKKKRGLCIEKDHEPDAESCIILCSILCCMCCVLMHWAVILETAVAALIHIFFFFLFSIEFILFLALLIIEGIFRLLFVLPCCMPCSICFTLSRCLLFCNGKLHNPRCGTVFLVLYYPLFWMSLSFRWISKHISKWCPGACVHLEFDWSTKDGQKNISIQQFWSAFYEFYKPAKDNT